MRYLINRLIGIVAICLAAAALTTLGIAIVIYAVYLSYTELGLPPWLVFPCLSVAAAGIGGFALRYAMTFPVLVHERVGPLAALRRSAELTRRNRWRVLGAGTLVALTFVVVLVAALTAFSLLGRPDWMVWFMLFGIPSLAAIVLAILNAAVYRDLRRAHDGPDPSEIAIVFD